MGVHETSRQHVQRPERGPPAADQLEVQQHPAPGTLLPVRGEGEGLAGRQEVAEVDHPS